MIGELIVVVFADDLESIFLNMLLDDLQEQVQVSEDCCWILSFIDRSEQLSIIVSATNGSL